MNEATRWEHSREKAQKAQEKDREKAVFSGICASCAFLRQMFRGLFSFFSSLLD